MAWTAPRTWVAAEVVTAALLNTHLRDNLLDLRDRPAGAAVTAVGGVTSSGTLYYLRGGGGLAVVSINVTTTSAQASSASIFTLPVGVRPNDTIFGTVVNSTGEANNRISVDSAGICRIGTATLAGDVLRGQIVLPLP